MATPQDLQVEIERLRAENESLKAKTRRGTYLKVSEKGGVSLYGLGRFPITLYVEQWEKILDMAPEIRQFMEENKGQLKRKEQPSD
jgi:hypothetical protein